jgi:TRAP-type C4-dicarboxylate transport system permease small subunit
MVKQGMPVLSSVSRGALVLGSILMLGMGAATVVNVILRLFNIAMTGFLESIELMMVVTVFGAMSFAAFEKSQVAVDVLVNRLSPSNKIKLEILSLIANFLFWGLLGWATLDWVLSGAYEAITDVLHVPMWPFQILWLFGLLFFSLVYLQEFIQKISQRNKSN